MADEELKSSPDNPNVVIVYVKFEGGPHDGKVGCVDADRVCESCDQVMTKKTVLVYLEDGRLCAACGLCDEPFGGAFIGDAIERARSHGETGEDT